MLLNESQHPYIPTFKLLKHGNATYGKAPLLFALLWVIFSHGYIRMDDCFKWLLFFCGKMVGILRGVCASIKKHGTNSLGIRNIIGVGFEKSHKHVCSRFVSRKASRNLYFNN
jgi:hypothetical protein